MTPEKLHEWYEKVKKAKYKHDEITWNNERRRCQIDLFYLAKNILGYDLVDSFMCPTHWTVQSSEPDMCLDCEKPLKPYPGGIPAGTSVHREICNFFIHKNPDLSIANQDTIKERLLLCPRGSFKSSIDECDTIQWMLAFPDIRIGLLTAEFGLAKSFISKVKNFFTVIEDEKGNREYTKFQLLFPEHCVSSKRQESDDRFTTPAREKFNKEPSLHAISLAANTSGWHYDVGKYDDCESNANSGPSATSEQRDTVRQNITLAGSLIEPYGYHDHLGTPYDETDSYSYKIERSSPEDLRVLIKSGWQVKKDSRAKKEEELSESDYEILFPIDGKGEARLTYGFLRKKQNEDAVIFACQYLCRPSASKRVKFTDQLLRSCIVTDMQLPIAPEYYAAWDIAYSSGSNSSGRDFTVGCVGAKDLQDRTSIVEVVRGRFDTPELVHHIANLAKKWQVKKIFIEDSGGAHFLLKDIQEKLVEYGYPDCPMPEFFPVDAKKGAKEMRASRLQIVMEMGRLLFWQKMGDILEIIIKEFVKFKAGSKRKDDVVDSIAHLVDHIPTPMEKFQTDLERRSQLYDIFRRKTEHEMIFDKSEPVPPMFEDPLPMDYEGMPVFKNPDEILYGRQ